MREEQERSKRLIVFNSLLIEIVCAQKLIPLPLVAHLILFQNYIILLLFCVEQSKQTFV